MIKEIIATALLSASVGSASNIEFTRKDAVSNNYLQGSYCIREEIDYTALNEYMGDSWFIQPGTCDYSTYYDDTFYIMYAEGIFFQIGDSENNIVFGFEEDDTYHYVYIRFGHTYSDMDSIAKTFQFTFMSPVHVENNYLQAFNLVFTKEGNTYNQVYTGWYTFNYSASNLSGWYVYGTMNINNTLYNGLVNNYSKLSAYYYDYDGDYSWLELYDSDNKFTGNVQTAYLTGVMINDSAYPFMTHYGSFNFVPQTNQYTFGQMIFNVVDAPIYMLSQLFSFELFGIQFYVAFMGIVTVVLICFVLRKII